MSTERERLDAAHKKEVDFHKRDAHQLREDLLKCKAQVKKLQEEKKS